MTNQIVPVDEIVKSRGDVYGSFTDICSIAESLMTSLRSGESWHMLRPDQKQALAMMTHKMARIVCGNTQYRDNWADIEGYAKLVVREIDRRVEENVK